MELDNILEQNPDFIDTLLEQKSDVILQGLGKKGFVVRTSNEDADFLANYEKNIIPTKVEAAVSEKMRESTFEIATKIEKDIFEKTGIKKNENEKYYNYLKRAFDEVKGNSVETDRLNEYIQENTQLKSLLEEKENEFKKNILDFKKSTAINAVLDNIQFATPSHLTTDEERAEYVKVQKNFIKNDFNTRISVKDTEAGLVFYDGDKILLDTKTNAFLQPQDIIKGMYKTFIAPEKQPDTGMGTGGKGFAQVGKMTSDQFSQYASEKGLIVGSQEWLSQRKELVAA